MQAGLVLQSTLSSLGSAYGPSVALGYQPSDRVGVALEFQGPLFGAGASSAAASVKLQSEQLLGQIFYRIPAGTFGSVDLVGIVGAHRLEVEGSARSPYAGRSDTAVTALAGAGTDIEVEFTRSAALVGFGRAMFLAPRPVVRMAGSEFSYGRPTVQAGAALRVYF